MLKQKKKFIDGLGVRKEGKESGDEGRVWSPILSPWQLPLLCFLCGKKEIEKWVLGLWKPWFRQGTGSVWLQDIPAKNNVISINVSMVTDAPPNAGYSIIGG